MADVGFRLVPSLHQFLISQLYIVSEKLDATREQTLGRKAQDSDDGRLVLVSPRGRLLGNHSGCLVVHRVVLRMAHAKRIGLVHEVPNQGMLYP